MRATKVNAGLAESNGRLLLGIWRDSLHVTCGLTACIPGSAPGPTLGNEYGKTLPFYHVSEGSVTIYTRYGGSLNNHFSANKLQNLTVKEFGKSVKIWKNYGDEFSVVFLAHPIVSSYGMCDCVHICFYDILCRLLSVFAVIVILRLYWCFIVLLHTVHVCMF